jgi:PAS domain S-box-containing protein
MKPLGASELLHGLGAWEILDSLADGAYITDTERRILFWNRAAERITGWKAEEVVGHRCQDNILSHVDKDGHPLCGNETCPLRRSIITGQPSALPLLIFANSKSGKRIPVEVTVAPVRDAAGKVVAGIELFRDVTATVQDMMRAQVIQQSCLECALADDARIKCEVRYTPSEIVGGDFYRVERLDGNRYAVLVADVMGHGLAAALYSVQLRSFWEDQRGQLDSPARFLGTLNQHLRAMAPDALFFATAVCANINAATGRITYVCAGHCPPLLLRAGGAVETAIDSQPGLGLFDALCYSNLTQDLAPGDGLLLYTDGALEISDQQDEDLGIPGLVRLIEQNIAANPAHQLQLARLEEQLLLYSHNVRLSDDLTLLKFCRLK